jgi:hypothetical protein
MVLFSRLRVNLAMSSHSAANRKNFSAGSSMSWFLPVLVSCLELQNQNAFERFPMELRRFFEERVTQAHARPSARLRRSDQPGSAARLQLAVPLEDIAAAVADLKAVGNECGAAAHQIAPGHAAIAIAEPGGGGPAGRQILHVDRPRDRARQTEEKTTGDNILHAQTAPPFFADGFSPANLARRLETLLTVWGPPWLPCRQTTQSQISSVVSEQVTGQAG